VHRIDLIAFLFTGNDARPDVTGERTRLPVEGLQLFAFGDGESRNCIAGWSRHSQRSHRNRDIESRESQASPITKSKNVIEQRAKNQSSSVPKTFASGRSNSTLIPLQNCDALHLQLHFCEMKIHAFYDNRRRKRDNSKRAFR